MKPTKNFSSFLGHFFLQAIKFPWIINWILSLLLVTIVFVFKSKDVTDTIFFDFFSYDGRPDTIVNFVLQQILFIFSLYCIAFGVGIRMVKISKLIAVFSFLVVISMYILLWPILLNVFIP
jgi:hypothetical protein